MSDSPLSVDAVRPATRVVGIGASAGGLVPLEEFLRNVPPASGLAYVVVQHLDPRQKPLLTELLQRITPMHVQEAVDGLRVESDQVYVIPPNAELRVTGDRLHVTVPSQPRGLRLPIDALFSSLASSHGERAIAVVLSGMGSDGTLGALAVKTVGGLTAVQRPDTAEFAAMPESVIAANCADLVAPPAELPLRIVACIADLPRDAAEDAPAARNDSPLTTVLHTLRERTRHDFSRYKPTTVLRRIERRMAVHGCADMSEYARLLVDNPQEVDLLFKELLIGVTSFFRDPQVWSHLGQVALPELVERRPPGHALRAWCIGCSTGEEAYSLAILFDEVLRKLARPQRPGVKIFASDLSPDAIAMARRGRYPASIAADVGPERLARYFTARDGVHLQIAPTLRDLVLFAQHDVALDPPFTKLDLIVCRNLLIYFDASLQRHLIPLLHYSLNPGGLLLLGSAETVGAFTQLFTSRGEASIRLYDRSDEHARGTPEFLMKPVALRRPPDEESAVPPSDPIVQNPVSLQAAADRLLLQAYSPAAVVVNGGGDIVYISGRTGNYLEPAAGKANWNFHAMLREGLRAPLADALARALRQNELVQCTGLRVAIPGGEQRVDVAVQHLREPQSLHGMTMFVFRDVAPQPPVRRRRRGSGALESEHAIEIARFQEEIRVLREESQASREELQSANEELQSANEELQSTNEELQSTNEELTTSKEEMQSMNEELQTINAELQAKLDDLALAQSDMQNLLNSTEIAILFLDRDLNVRRYTERAAKIINLRESDIGRPISDLTSSLRYPALVEDARDTLRTLVFREQQIETTDGRRVAVRIMPYRRLDDLIDGVVITFVESAAGK